MQFSPYNISDQIKKDEMTGACGAYKQEDKYSRTGL